jgi:hypothetical protein
MTPWTIEEVELDKIIPIHAEHVSKKGIAKRMANLNETNGYLSLLMIVEKEIDKDIYCLVAGYPEYKAYVHWGKKKKICCFVQPYSDYTKQRMTLLTRMFNHQVTSWLDKHTIIKQMIDNGQAINRIAKQIGVSTEDIQTYLIHPDIPRYIIPLAFKNKGSFPNLDQIRRLDLPYILKCKLYDKAILPRGHKERITTDKLQKLKWLLNDPEAKDLTLLTIDNQWEMLERVLKYKYFLIDLWRNDLRDFLQGEST